MILERGGGGIVKGIGSCRTTFEVNQLPMLRQPIDCCMKILGFAEVDTDGFEATNVLLGCDTRVHRKREGYGDMPPNRETREFTNLLVGGVLLEKAQVPRSLEACQQALNHREQRKKKKRGERGEGTLTINLPSIWISIS